MSNAQQRSPNTSYREDNSSLSYCFYQNYYYCYYYYVFNYLFFVRRVSLETDQINFKTFDSYFANKLRSLSDAGMT